MPTRASPSPNRTARRGFTLVEAIATMVIISTLGSVASLTIAQAAAAYQAAATGGQLQAELSSAMDRVEREVRGIRHKAGTSAADISATTGSSVSWNEAGGTCSLMLSGGQLRLTTGGGIAEPLLIDVSSLTVQCYDESGSALPATLSGPGCEAIRRLSVVAVVTRYGSTATLRTGIDLRSTMTGAQ